MSKELSYDPVSVVLHCPDENDRTVTLTEGLISVDSAPQYRYTGKNAVAEYAVSVLMSMPDEIVDIAELDSLGASSSALNLGVGSFNRSVVRSVLYPPIQVLRRKNTVSGFTLHTSLDAAQERGVHFTYEGKLASVNTAEDRILLSPLEIQIRDFLRDTRGTAHTLANISDVIVGNNHGKTADDVIFALKRLYGLRDKDMSIFPDLTFKKNKNGQGLFGSKSEAE